VYLKSVIGFVNLEARRECSSGNSMEVVNEAKPYLPGERSLGASTQQPVNTQAWGNCMKTMQQPHIVTPLAFCHLISVFSQASENPLLVCARGCLSIFQASLTPDPYVVKGLKSPVEDCTSQHPLQE
jgi:hypothetical protein